MNKNKKLCECGCGEEVKPGNRFIWGHNARCRSEETLRKIGEASKRENLSPEQLRKRSEALKGKNNPMYGKCVSLEDRKKRSERAKRENLSLETI